MTGVFSMRDICKMWRFAGSDIRKERRVLITITMLRAWLNFAAYQADTVLNEGYPVTADYKHGEDYEWICLDCFQALNEQLQWRCVES
jgi:hypothetical protein